MGMIRKLHPALQARAAAVKQAHAHLTRTVPGFASQHPHERVRQVQAHIQGSVKATKPGGY